ncbi:hypothetical protein SLE2022_251750 [Rubroshorea leprosula]|uniref:Transmembrane protein n=1 Tax=Rubroshorea leprosula TaxID=152421 RepID=A0AAV5HFY4_9ROSI|nr:hypothetical protein SLEP1_g290 [Rubroshorea leprosula]
MEIQQSRRLRFSYKNATIVLTILNALFLLRGFLPFASTRTKLSLNHPNSVDLKYIKESEEMRLAMQPLELIKRVREIEQEAYAEPEVDQQKEAKQTAALDLSKRLKDFRSLNDAANFKALEEWRKRKMERARLREQEKNETSASQA